MLLSADESQGLQTDGTSTLLHKYYLKLSALASQLLLNRPPTVLSNSKNSYFLLVSDWPKRHSPSHCHPPMHTLWFILIMDLLLKHLTPTASHAWQFELLQK